MILLKKVKNNLSLFFLYLIIIIPTIALMIFLTSSYSFHKEEEIEKNEQIAKIVAENLDYYIKNIKSTLTSLSTLPPVQNNNREEVENIFKNIMIQDNQVSLYWTKGIDGEITAKYPKVFPDKSNHQYFIEELNESFTISEPRTCTMTDEKIITISTLIKDNYGKTKGVIGAAVPLEKLKDILEIEVGRSGYPVLITKKGNEVIQIQSDKILNEDKIDATVFKQIIQRNSSGTIDTFNMDNQPVYLSYVPLNQTEWKIVVVQPYSELIARISNFFTKNAILLLLMLLLIISNAYFLVYFRRKEEEKRTIESEKLSVVGQLAAGMAHEIRNPLTSIRGFIQLAQKENYTFSKEHLDIMIDEVDRMEEIIKETLILAKPSPLKIQPINMNHLLKEVCTLMMPLANLEGVELNCSNDKDLPQINGVPSNLKQVFINLIKNSLESIKVDHGIIAISTELNKEYILIKVKDNGCGIPKNILERLGNPFVTTKDYGTGLGLMIVYRIIQNHHGKIGVNSTEGKGTTFTISLPIMQNWH